MTRVACPRCRGRVAVEVAAFGGGTWATCLHCGHEWCLVEPAPGLTPEESAEGAPARAGYHQNRSRGIPDRGCVVWPSCLSCPLPVCLEELPPRQAVRLRALARQQSRRCRHCGGEFIAVSAVSPHAETCSSRCRQAACREAHSAGALAVQRAGRSA